MSAAGTELPTFDAEVLLALDTPLLLEPDAVHVWSFTLEGSPDFVAKCRNVLSAAERQRADRFVFPEHRMRHTVAHAVVRKLLSRYGAGAPEALQFGVAGTAGKPVLQSVGGTPPSLCFNLTHSEERGLLGVSQRRELGIDVEKLRTTTDALGISRNYFFESEYAAIENASEANRDQMFLRYWVAKEAVLKAQGVGLGFPLDRFRIEFLDDPNVARVETLDPTLLSGDWTVRLLPCEPGWLGAVAARGDAWELQLERPG